MCRGISPLATCPVVIKPFSEVFLIAAILVAPLEFRGLAPVGGGGAGPLGSLIHVVGRDNREAVLHEEAIVVCQPELGEPDGSDPYDEGDEVPSEVSFKVEETLEVLGGSSLSVDGLEVAEVVLVFRVCITAVLGVVAIHPSVLLESTQY